MSTSSELAPLVWRRGGAHAEIARPDRARRRPSVVATAARRFPCEASASSIAWRGGAVHDEFCGRETLNGVVSCAVDRSTGWKGLLSSATTASAHRAISSSGSPVRNDDGRAAVCGSSRPRSELPSSLGHSSGWVLADRPVSRRTRFKLVWAHCLPPRRSRKTTHATRSSSSCTSLAADKVADEVMYAECCHRASHSPTPSAGDARPHDRGHLSELASE